MLLYISSFPILPLSSFILQRKHLLIALLSLEAISLTLALLALASKPQPIPAALTILSFGACEASVGLALLVSMSRHYGNDLLSSLALNKW